jgi:hypothetical protein
MADRVSPFELEGMFDQVKELDSMAFVEIPQPQIADTRDYRNWLVEDVEVPWIVDFNGNEHWYPRHDWNTEGGVGGRFGRYYFIKCKMYKYDGTNPAFVEGDWRSKRGLLIRDHYSPIDVVKVKLITDNLVDFLRQRKISFARLNFEHPSRELIAAEKETF